MKKYKNLIRYHFIMYLKTNKYVMPLAVWIIVLLNAYSAKPVSLVSSMLVTATALCLIMAWTGMTYFESLDVTAEQLMLLKVSKRADYNRSKYAFLALLGSILSLSAVLIPAFLNIANGFQLFTKTFTLMDMLTALAMHVLCGVLGMAAASLFQPVCIKERKLAVLSLAVFCVVALVKGTITAGAGVWKYFLWVAPPLSDMNALFYKCETFETRRVAVFILYGVVYSTVYLLLANYIAKKKLF